MTSGDWQPEQYGRFEQQRAQPFWTSPPALPPTLPSSGRSISAVAPGALTARVASWLDVAAMVGVDNSPNMLSAAADHADERTSFEAGRHRTLDVLG